VGTAINIARACNIMPSNARVIEVTTEEFPVLNQLDTATLIEIQEELASLGVPRTPEQLAKRDAIIEQRTAELDALHPGLVEVREALQEHVIYAAEESLRLEESSRSQMCGNPGGHGPAPLSPIREQSCTPTTPSARPVALKPKDGVALSVVCGAASVSSAPPPPQAPPGSPPPGSPPPTPPDETEATAAKQAASADSDTTPGPGSSSPLFAPFSLPVHMASIAKALPSLSAADSRDSHRDSASINMEKDAAAEGDDLCLVIDEKAIEYCGTLCAPALAAVGNTSRSVVACRARKDQKAQMLKLIKDFVPTSCCLAVGDGANDVAMIKEGQIGIGIIGKEGRDCVNAADFAIGQFQFLRSLLLVHGRYNYRRFAIFLYFSFYKNILCQMALFFWSMEAMASTQLLLPSIVIDFLNPLILTALPIIVFPMFDTDVPKQVSAHSPHLYTVGLARIHYTHKKMVFWILEAFYAGLIIGYAPQFANDYYTNCGSNVTLSELSMGAMFVVTISINVRLTLENNSWSVVEVVALVLMIIATFAFAIVMNYNVSYTYGGGWTFPLMNFTFHEIFPSFIFWAQLVLVVFLVCLPRLLAQVVYMSQQSSSSTAHGQQAGQQAAEIREANEERNALARQRTAALLASEVPAVNPLLKVDLGQLSERSTNLNLASSGRISNRGSSSRAGSTRLELGRSNSSLGGTPVAPVSLRTHSRRQFSDAELHLPPDSPSSEMGESSLFAGCMMSEPLPKSESQADLDREPVSEGNDLGVSRARRMRAPSLLDRSTGVFSQHDDTAMHVLRPRYFDSDASRPSAPTEMRANGAE